jgi:AMMECR1 domain-containing protein
MELELIRSYDPEGTNGELKLVVCNTIELPWLQNKRSVSCIPEGRYELRLRSTAKRGQHLLVVNVKGRDGILIHPANDAKKELRGCIGPVTNFTGPGKGSQSRLANEKLKALVLQALKQNEKVFITIKSNKA